MKYLFFIGIISYCFSVSGQNLIPNPSFEDLLSCPSWRGQVERATPWTNPNNFSPDLYNSCAGTNCDQCVPTSFLGEQDARTGDGYVGLIFLGTALEYIQVQLLSPLIAGETYKLSYFVSISDNSTCKVDQLGAYFSTSQVTGTGLLNFVPQTASNPGEFIGDYSSWELVTSTFVASGGERFITLGNFKGFQNTNFVRIGGIGNFTYFYIDDIELILVEDILGNDTTLCEGETLVLNASTSGATYLWQDNSTDSIFEVTQSGIYWVEVNDNMGSRRDTITITYDPLPIVNLGNDTALCEGETLVLNASTLGATYLWQDNSTDASYIVDQSGSYRVVVAMGNCITTDTVNISYKTPPQIALEDELKLCEGELLLLNVVNSNATYLWQDGSIDSIFTVSSSGVYSVEVINDCGTIRDTVVVELDNCKCNLFIPNVFTPNGDGHNDQFSVIFDNCIPLDYQLKIYNRWGTDIFTTNDYRDVWDGSLEGKDISSGVYVYSLIYKFEGEGKIYKIGMVTLLR